jgi:cell division protease FtsH
VDEEVKKLIENAHNEAWEILVENRDVLDNLVLALLEKETLNKEELAEVFAPVVKRPPRPAWTGSPRRSPSTRPPVQSPKELALTNGTAPQLGATTVQLPKLPEDERRSEN